MEIPIAATHIKKHAECSSMLSEQGTNMPSFDVTIPFLHAVNLKPNFSIIRQSTLEHSRKES